MSDENMGENVVDPVIALVNLKNTVSELVKQDKNIIGVLDFQGNYFTITKSKITIGKNSNRGAVDVDMGPSTYISRVHLDIEFEHPNFYLVCKGKNGVFIDGVFQRRNSSPFLLPEHCIIRFPSTAIKIMFLSLVKKELVEEGSHHPVDNDDTINIPPLNISIPNDQQVISSPALSPTGTISAANSCPSSPRGGIYARRPHIPMDIPASHLEVATSAEEKMYESTQLPMAISNDHSLQQVVGRGNPQEKPLYSYAQLIVQAISSAPERQLTLSGIYSYITKNYPYYRNAEKGWQNSIRHNLSLNRYFVKVARTQEEPGKGSFWKIDTTSETKLLETAFKQRRQRGSHPYKTNTSRSAPASPSHVTPDISLASSPQNDNIANDSIQEGVLGNLASPTSFSAPGSPSSYVSFNNGNNGSTRLIVVPQQQTNGDDSAHRNYGDSANHQPSVIVQTPMPNSSSTTYSTTQGQTISGATHQNVTLALPNNSVFSNMQQQTVTLVLAPEQRIFPAKN